MPGFIGPWELILLAVVLFALFGASRLPAVGRQLGRGTREAAKSVREVKQAVSVGKAADAEKPAEPEGLPVTPKSALKRLID